MKHGQAEIVLADAKRAGLVPAWTTKLNKEWLVYATKGNEVVEIASPEELAKHLGNPGMVHGVAKHKTAAEKGSFLDAYEGRFGHYTSMTAPGRSEP